MGGGEARQSWRFQSVPFRCSGPTQGCKGCGHRCREGSIPSRPSPHSEPILRSLPCYPRGPRDAQKLAAHPRPWQPQGWWSFLSPGSLWPLSEFSARPRARTREGPSNGQVPMSLRKAASPVSVSSTKCSQGSEICLKLKLKLPRPDSELI